MFLKNRRAMMAAISSMLAMIFMLFFDSTLACELKEEMGVGEDYVGKYCIKKFIHFRLLLWTYLFNIRNFFPVSWLDNQMCSKKIYNLRIIPPSYFSLIYVWTLLITEFPRVKSFLSSYYFAIVL